MSKSWRFICKMEILRWVITTQAKLRCTLNRLEVEKWQLVIKNYGTY